MTISDDSVNALLDSLLELHPKKIDLSLDRSFTLLNKLGNPQDKIDNAKQLLTDKVPSYDWQNQWNATIQGGNCQYVIDPDRVPTEGI